MSGSAATPPSRLLLCITALAAVCMLLACESKSRVTFGDSTTTTGGGDGVESGGGDGGGDGGDGGDDGANAETVEGEGADASLFTAAEAIRAATGAATLDPAHLAPLQGRGVLLFDRVSESIIYLDLDGHPIRYTPREELLATTGSESVALGRMHVIEEGPFHDQALCVDEVSGLLLRIGVDGIPHVHAADTQVLAATGGSRSQLHLPRSMASDQIVAQDLESRHILSFGVRGDARVLVEGSDLALAAGVPVDATEIAAWARGPVSGDQFASFGATNAVVRVRVDGTVHRYIHHQVIPVVFPRFENPAIIGLATETAGTDDLYLLVSDGGQGRGILLASPNGAIREFSNFNNLSRSGGPVDIFAFGFLTIVRDRFFYALDQRGASVFTLDERGAPEEISGPDVLLRVTEAPRVRLGEGVAVHHLGLLVLEPESGSFVRLRPRPRPDRLASGAPRNVGADG